jgi:YD repeat-containing protein
MHHPADHFLQIPGAQRARGVTSAISCMRRAVLSVVVVVLSLAAPVAQAACNPAQQCCADPGTGEPCDAAAGNPLNVISGNKFQREVDMPALPGVLGLELVRHYNSQDSHTFSARRLLGRGWRLSYDVQVQRQGLQGLTLTQADGTQVHYYRVPIQPDRLAGTLFRSNQPHQGDMLLRGNSDPRIRYVLTLPDKSQQWFDAQGLLVQLNVPSGQATDILRDPQGRILRVTDPQGRELRFTYPSAAQRKDTVQFHGVQSIDTPVGTFHYTYDTPAPQVLTQPPDSPAYRRAAQRLANLLQVQGPGPTTKTYHYEDQRWPTLLTGISIAGTGIEGTQRQVSWAYDSRGRAILSVKGAYDKTRAGPQQVTLDFSGQKTDGSGTTVLTNSLGQTTRYTYHSINHKPELVEVIGPGCASCGPTNVRHGYNAKGQRTSTTQLDAQGAPLHTTLTQYDGADRPIEIRQVRYLRGKAQAAQLLQRIDYGADPETLKPRLIERPSVVPGKQHRILFTYNQAGQPTEITETGYEPIGQQPISRTTRYAYTSINGRSLLTHIDGPLPNGPANSPEDSDITTVQWDARGGYILRRTEPGPITTALEHDSAGRVVRSSLNDG